ncbi:MAG: hypothetical protein HZB55_17060 [Deltaproteobacteria bacterium]|nr:hypothetical protein [Deltaproteobacteria bacterium]
MEVDVLSLLAKLQSVADDIDRLDARRKAATEERDRVEASLQGAQDSLTQCRERLHNLDIERRKRELGLKAERERSSRVKSRLGEVKTSREYQAVLAEISAAKQAVTELEEALSRDMEAVEASGAEIRELEAQVEGMQTDLDRAGKTLDDVLKDTEQAILDRRSEETEVLRSLPLEVVDRYRLIRMRRGGLAVVEARNEACTACFMRIPPQTYIEVMRRSRVIQCPNCHRILIPPQPVAEGPTGVGE